jgi:hypothetical protein
MGIGQLGLGTSYDTRLSTFLWRNGSSKERSKHDDDVDGDNRNRKCALGYLRI